MAITSEITLSSLAEAKCWVLDQVTGLTIENIARLLDLVPCPFAYGTIACKINPRCQAKVDRKIRESGKTHYYCFYEDIPVVSEEVIIPVTAGLIALYLPDLVDKLAELLFSRHHTKDEKKIFAEMYMFSSSYLGQLILKKDPCLPCMYRNEVKKQKKKQKRVKTASKSKKSSVTRTIEKSPTKSRTKKAKKSKKPIKSTIATTETKFTSKGRKETKKKKNSE